MCYKNVHILGDFHEPLVDLFFCACKCSAFWIDSRKCWCPWAAPNLQSLKSRPRIAKKSGNSLKWLAKSVHLVYIVLEIMIMVATYHNLFPVILGFQPVIKLYPAVDGIFCCQVASHY